MDDDLRPPQSSAGDLAHAGLKAGLSTLPVLGGAIAELIDQVLKAPMERRGEQWMRSVAEAIAELRDRVDGFDVEKLAANETFVSALVHATQIATRTHQEEKLQALRNAITNSVLPNAPDEDRQHMFFRMIDDLTPWHLRIARLFDDPVEWARAKGVDYGNQSMGGLAQVLEAAFPELRGRRELYDQFWSELRGRGLVTTDGLHTTMTASTNGMYARRTSDFGREFLIFISRSKRR